MDIAVLGTGLMGAPLAERLAGAGHTVTAFNRTISKSQHLATHGVSVAPTAREAVERASHILLMLSDGDAIRDVLLSGDAREVLANRSVIQMGTILPAESRDLAGEVAAAGGDYFEVPVLGSIAEVRNGTLLLMVGGSTAQFEESRELLGSLGPNPIHVGPVGMAAALKLALNQLIASLTAGFAFSLGLVRREGIDVDLFMGLLRESALYAPTFDKKLTRMLDRDFSKPNFPTKHLAKDVRLMREEGRELGLRTDLLAAITRILDSTQELDLGDADYSALYEAVDPANEGR